MASSSSSRAMPSRSVNAAEIITLKVKTMDDRTHTLRVNKEIPVFELKEHIAIMTGVDSELQRLICRGVAMKNDHLLSNYRVEDGHTLHMVARLQPHPSFNLFLHSAGEASTPRSHGPANWEGQVRGGTQFFISILGTLGTRISRAIERRNAAGRQASRGGSRTQQSEGQQRSSVNPNNAMETMSQYLNLLRQQMDNANGMQHNDARTISVSEQTVTSLVELIRSTRHMFMEQAEIMMLYAARALEEERTATNPVRRSALQTRAERGGALFHNLGALLLELGRVVTSVQMGQTVNGASIAHGPAVFVSATAPNSISAQPSSTTPEQSQAQSLLQELRLGEGIVRLNQSTRQNVAQTTPVAESSHQTSSRTSRAEEEIRMVSLEDLVNAPPGAQNLIAVPSWEATEEHQNNETLLPEGNAHHLSEQNTALHATELEMRHEIVEDHENAGMPKAETSSGPSSRASKRLREE